MDGVDSDYATLVRTAVVAVVMAALVVWLGKWRSPASLPGRSLVYLVLSGLATGASWICYFRALKLGEAAKVAVIDKLSVALIVLFAVVFLGERPSLRDWLGIGLILAGLFLLSLRR